MTRSSRKLAIAASVAVLAIGVPFTIRYLQDFGPLLPAAKRTSPIPPAIPPAPSPIPPASSPDVGAPARPQSLAVVPLSPQSAVEPRSLQLERRDSLTLGPQRDAARTAESDRLRQAVSAAKPVSERAASEGESRAPGYAVEEGRDRFQTTAPNPIRSVATDPVSTFSIDVDTGSYSFVRRALLAGRLPTKNAVRIEEMINYFPYDYARPKDRSTPFAPTVTVMPAPWNPANRLMHVAIKGYDLEKDRRPRANLVFLVDSSGSMAAEDRLPLLKNALRLLLDSLHADDSVGIVTYAGQSRTVLEPTKVSEKAKIIAAIDQLQAAGGTAGSAGLQDAYGMAERAFDKQAVNRIILGTDGDFNIGITDTEELKSFVERKRQTGIFLSVLGFGRGNFNDALMQALAQNGNGTAAYIDTLGEARKVLAEEASSTLFPIAKDVKIQVEFNPAAVSEYRLIGYETRMLRREDFNNDKVDAGEVGSGHSVTAIYEFTPTGAPTVADGLRYQPTKAPSQPASSTDDQEFAFVKIRYKLPSEDVSRVIEAPVRVANAVSIEDASAEVRFSVAVAAFGQLLRAEPYLRSFNYDDVTALANGAKGADPFGYRAEFVNLVRLAKFARP